MSLACKMNDRFKELAHEIAEEFNDSDFKTENSLWECVNSRLIYFEDILCVILALGEISNDPEMTLDAYAVDLMMDYLTDSDLLDFFDC